MRPGGALDLGCGAAWSTLALQRVGYDAVGLDLHERPEALAAYPELAYVRGDAASLPFEDASFDVAGLYQALEHMTDPRRVLEECRRVLRPGGRLVIVGPNLESPALAALVAARLTLRRANERTPKPRFSSVRQHRERSAARAQARHARNRLVAASPTRPL